MHFIVPAYVNVHHRRMECMDIDEDRLHSMYAVSTAPAPLLSVSLPFASAMGQNQLRHVKIEGHALGYHQIGFIFQDVQAMLDHYTTHEA